MSFDSLQYLIFLPVTALLYRLCPGRRRWALLLAASYYFYMQWNVSLSLLILGVTAQTWLAGLLLSRLKTKRQRQWCVGISMAVCFGLLGYFKYFGFLSRSLSAAVAALGGSPWQTWDVILPVGISFFTFQALSYVVDVYRGDLPPEKHFGYYALYVSFFPQLVAGPIERATNLLPQLRRHADATGEDVRQGLRLLLSGLFRKVVVADFAGVFVERIYSLSAPDGAAVCIATLLFALQIYCDFAGYSEIAAGSARLMGFTLMRNFDRPYLAGSLREFWRRWHISLSTWFSDYVYIPLGGSRRGIRRQLLATMAVFILSGLWHGAAWTFVVWGVLHGLMMGAGILLRRPDAPRRRGMRLLSWAGTFSLVCFTWIFFRAESLQHAGLLIGRLFSPWSPADALAQLAWTAADTCRLLLTLAVLPLMHRLSLPDEREGDMTCVLLIIVIALAWLVRLESDVVSAFIYFQF